MPQELGKCPDCHQWILVPEGTASVDLICPWCGRGLDASEIECQPVRPAISTTNSSRRDTSPAAVDVPIDDVLAVHDLQPVATPSVAERRAKSPSRRNGLLEAAKIVAGGLAGLAIAQLILWWTPGVGRRDPLRLAPHVPGWLSIIVPTELRPDQERGQDQ